MRIFFLASHIKSYFSVDVVIIFVFVVFHNVVDVFFFFCEWIYGIWYWARVSYPIFRCMWHSEYNRKWLWTAAFLCIVQHQHPFVWMYICLWCFRDWVVWILWRYCILCGCVNEQFVHKNQYYSIPRAVFFPFHHTYRVLRLTASTRRIN